MATSTERYKVIEPIRIFISLIFTLNIAKGSERHNMMHVQFFSQPAFGHFAMLATIVVALASSAALSIPVRPVIFFVATSPVMVLFANSVLRLPYPITRSVAKMVFVGLCAIRNDKYINSAPRTNRRNAIICGVVLTNSISRMVFTTTTKITKEVFGSNEVVCAADKRCAAFCARNLYGHSKPLIDKLVTCSGFTAINKGAYIVYHKLLELVNPEQYHYTTYVLQTVVKWR